MALINNSQILGSGSTDLILNTRGKIYVKVGDRFYELDFKNEGNKESSITNNTIINNPEQDLSPYVTKKYLKAALGEYVTKRNWEDLMQTKDAIENAQLEGFTESITPITVNTMQMVVGTQNLQFDFITSLKDDTVISPGLYINEFGQLVCPRGVIKHYTLFGPQSVKKDTKIQYYARWTIQGDDGGDYALLDLTEEDKPYYVYLRVNTTGYKDITDDDVTQNIEVDPKSKNTGNWFVSTQSHAIEEEDGYAYLLVALVTGSNAGGRSIGYLNGFTEILPGQITAYVFKTADGNQYLDFLNNKFRIGNNDQYIDWNGENLNIKGSLSVIGGDLQDTLNNLQAQIDDEIQCWFSTDSEIEQQIPFPNSDNQTASPNWPVNMPDWNNKNHIGDLYYVVEDDNSTQDVNEQGQAYRYIKDGDLYYWTRIVDNSISLALYNAYLAQQTANNAQNILNDIANDNIITIQEHGQLRELLKSVLAQCEQTIASADPYKNIQTIATTISDLNTKKDTLSTVVNNILNQTDNYTISGEYQEAWNNVFEALKNLSTEIAKELNNQISDVNYIKKALKGRTDITGGLVLTGLIELGFGLADPNNENYYDSFRVMSGINGILKPNDNGIYNYTDPAVWFGGGMLDLENPADLLNPEIYTLVIQKNNGEYNKYLKDTSIEKYLYKWKKGQDTYYSLTESGQPFVNYWDSDEPLKPTLSLTSGTIFQFDKFLELTLNTVTFNDPSGTTFQLQGKIQACKIGETEGNYTVNNIDNGIVEQLSGNFHKYIVSSHEKESLNNAIELLGETIFVYLSDNLNIKGIVFTIRNVYYYTRCSGIPKDITGFLHSFTIGVVPFVNVYERQDTETFSLYGWKYNDNYIYTLTDYDNPEPKYLYTLSESGIPQYTSDYTIIDCYNNLAKAMFRMNGSGYLANGNISWDTEGNIIMNKISVQSGKIGPLEIESSESGSSVKVKSDNKTILDITNKSVVINGKLTTKSEWNDDFVISVSDPIDVPIFNVSAQSLSAENITTYVRKSSEAVFINAKGSILGGTVTVPENSWYPILESQYIPSGAIYKITKFGLGYNINRISSPIKGHIYAAPVEEWNGKEIIIISEKIELFSWTWSSGHPNAIFTIDNLNLKEFTIAPSLGLGGRKWGVFLYLEPGGQVKSGVASDSWIHIWATTDNEAEIKLTNEEPRPGTFIGSNGISSIFGKNTKFQWIVPSANGCNYESTTDPRNTGGIFYIEIPYNENQSQTVGLRVIGFKGPDGKEQSSVGIQINTGSGWHKIDFDNNGILRIAD